MKKYETKYRVIPNPSFNDFNAELPYTIVAVDYDPKTDLIRQKRALMAGQIINAICLVLDKVANVGL